MNDIKRVVSLFLLVLAFVHLAWADTISDFADSKAINAPQTAVWISDIRTGEELASLNVDKPLIPASIMKSVTTATLLEKVGPDYRYVTPVYITGKLHDGVLDGNILIDASGDPTINTSHAPQTPDMAAEIVEALKSKNITTVNGKIIIDESRFPGPAVNPGWAAGDLPHAYGTGTHGFNFEDNASGKRSVGDPAAIFRERLKSAMARNGITIGNDANAPQGNRHKLCEHRSAPIDEIMRSCMMRSDNQFAESLLRLVGEAYGHEGSSSRGASEMTEFWKKKKAHMGDVNIADGSGLSRSNRVTARFMADVLRRMSRDPYYASFFPLAGEEGTLRRFLADTPLAGYIAMKTGSMNGIQCYAGYKLDADYEPTHIVVIMMNEMKDRASARSEVEKLLLSTFATVQE